MSFVNSTLQYLLVAFGIFCTAATASSQFLNEWVSLGPLSAGFSIDTKSIRATSGRPTAMMQHPTQLSTAYVTFGGGGLFRTTNFFDDNPIWTPLTDNLEFK